MDRKDILKQYTPDRENLLYILHDIQNSKKEKYLTDEDLQAVADYCNVSKAEVHGVVTFYTMFSVRKRGCNVIRLCISPPCHMMGSQSVLDYLKKTLNVKEGETTEDGLFTLETAACLGICAVAPAMMINDEMYGNLTPEKIDEIINTYREKKNG